MTRIHDMNLQQVNSKIASLNATLRTHACEAEFGMRPDQVIILLKMAEARRAELLA